MEVKKMNNSMEECTRQEIRLFVEEGLKDLEAGDVCNIEDVLDELRERYGVGNAAAV